MLDSNSDCRSPRATSGGFLRTLLLLALLTVSCARSGGEGALVLIVIDTLRADHVSSYGYPYSTTPRLDALAATGVRFARAFTPVPVTLPSVASVLTGRYPFHHSVRDNETYVLPPAEVTLAERFLEAGWRTGAVMASGVLSADRGLTQGFEDYDDRFKGPYSVYLETQKPFKDRFGADRRRANTVTQLALDKVRSYGNDKFFLLVHYFDPHAYYDPPPPHNRLHPGRPYDGEVSFVDAEIGRLLDGLTHRPDAVVAVVSDHGEGLHEHGEPEHGFLVYQSTVNVPMMVAGADIPKGVVRTDPVSLVDLEPSLAAHFELPPVTSPRDGRRLEWGAETGARPVPLYCETFRSLLSYGWSDLRAVVDGSWKLIQGPDAELYDVVADPQEVTDLAARPEHESRVKSMQEVLLAMTGGETREQVLAARKPDVDPERKERLESLGYIGGEEEELPDPEPVVKKTYPHPRMELPKWVEFQKAKVLNRVAVTHAGRGENEKALALFDSLIAYKPDWADVYYNRAVTRRNVKDAAGFRSDLRECLRLKPDFVPALVATASLDELEGRAETALEKLERVLELQPNHKGALLGISNFHLQRGQSEESLPYLRTLVSAAPEDVNARFNLGLAAINTGRLDEARSHFQVFLTLDPNHEKADQVRRILERQLK